MRNIEPVGKVEDVKHVAKSLKKFYADCGIPKPDEQVRVTVDGSVIVHRFCSLIDF